MGVHTVRKEEFCKLLDEMTSPDRVIDLLHAPNWRFWQKPQKIDEGQLFYILREYIETRTKKEDTHIRENTYLVLGKLLLRAMEPEHCQFFIDRLAEENDKYVLHSMLGCISRLRIPPEVNISELAACSRSDQWLVRHSAIQALGASDSEASREAVRYWVRHTDEKKFKFELIYANAVLGYIGVAEDIMLLENHIHSRIRDVRDTAAYAVENIRKRVPALSEEQTPAGGL